MKLIDRRQNFAIDGLEKTAFKIKASAKMFDILSSKLYSKPIEAIVRELSTNAVDAHIMVGKPDVKYNVGLPTNNNPYFEIRDFGPGLSVEEIYDVFTNIGESTKIDSNDFTGCLGLGSKSPFAYADTYNVSSYRDGVVYHYSCFKDELGIPNVAQFGEEETEEPNGLKITIAINPADHGAFIKAARRIYPYLSIKPNFTSNPIDIDEIQYEEKGQFWGTCKKRPNDIDGLMVVMGGVAYPVSSKIDHSDFNDIEKSLIHANIDITLNIGDVDIEAGREGLQFTKRTQNVLRHKFKQIVKHFTDQVQKDFNSCKSEWDVYCFAHDYENSIGGTFVHHIFSNIVIDINGKKIKPSTQYISGHGNELFQFSNNRVGCLKKYRTHSIRPSKKVVFINNDDSKAAYAKTRYYQESNPDKVVYFLDNPKDPLAKDKLAKSIGIDKSLIIDAATLPKKPRTGVVGSSSNGPKKKTAAAVKYVAHQSPQYSWKEAVVDVYTEVYYVPIDRYTPICDNKNVGVETVGAALKCLEIAGVAVPTEVYGFRKSLIEKLAKDKNCKAINLYNFAKEKIEKFDSKNNYTQKFSDCFYNKNVLGFRESATFKKIDLSSINPNSLIFKFIKEINNITQPSNSKELSVVNNFLKMFSGFSEKPAKIDLTKMKKEIILKYPILQVLDYCDVRKNDITEYINAIDNLKGV